jgi:hypothetical protein
MKNNELYVNDGHCEWKYVFPEHFEFIHEEILDLLESKLNTVRWNWEKGRLSNDLCNFIVRVGGLSSDMATCEKLCIKDFTDAVCHRYGMYEHSELLGKTKNVPPQSPPTKLQSTERGFSYHKFKDSYGHQCTLQESSSVSPRIWLGIDKPELTVFEDDSMGKYIVTSLPKNWMVDTRMHLSPEQVRELLPLLQKFADTGEL